MSAAQEAHTKRLAQLLESGRLTPAASPAPASPAAAGDSEAKPRRGTKRAHPKPNLSSVGEDSLLPDSINFVVAVSSRSADVGLENDHNLHCLCSFPTHQAAYDWIAKHRLALARHYLQDARLTEAELTASAAAFDELYLGEHTSMEILQVPHFTSAAGAPPPDATLFADHFASKLNEEEHEAAQAASQGSTNGDATGDSEGKDAPKQEKEDVPASAVKSPPVKGKKAAASKAAAKRRKT